VPLAGKYRLVDIPISNCINSGLRQVFVLTQYNSMSLNRHLARTYKFDQFTRGFVEVLAAQQTPDGERWYQGTADAVRQNLRYFLEGDYDYYLILSGDQLYRMDFREVMRQHIATGAELTIATLPVNARDATELSAS
jgi:glucose-1-phosphate adenylyltransferase